MVLRASLRLVSLDRMCLEPTFPSSMSMKPFCISIDSLSAGPPIRIDDYYIL